MFVCLRKALNRRPSPLTLADEMHVSPTRWWACTGAARPCYCYASPIGTHTPASPPTPEHQYLHTHTHIHTHQPRYTSKNRFHAPSIPDFMFPCSPLNAVHHVTSAAAHAPPPRRPSAVPSPPRGTLWLRAASKPVILACSLSCAALRLVRHAHTAVPSPPLHLSHQPQSISFPLDSFYSQALFTFPSRRHSHRSSLHTTAAHPTR